MAITSEPQKRYDDYTFSPAETLQARRPGKPIPSAAADPGLAKKVFRQTAIQCSAANFPALAVGVPDAILVPA